MDQLVDLGASLPTVGGAGILVVITVILGRLWLTAEKRHADELTRVNAAHDSELAELRQDVADLRGQVDDLNRRLDDERGLRRDAEDAAARALRGAGGGAHA